MKTLIRLSAITSLACALSACANGYADFYHQVAPTNIVLSVRDGTPPAQPEVMRGSYPVKDAVQEMARKGYGVLGYSSYNGPRGSVQDAVAQGKQVGADIVMIFDPRYAGSTTSSIPITTPTTQTTYSSGTATAYGPGGPVTAFGTGTSTTYGSTTNYVPFTVNRYDFVAVYLFKEHILIGFNAAPLTDAERQLVQSNSGERVVTVVDGSPAFNANILPGDILLSYDGHPFDAESRAFHDYEESKRGQTITLVIYRNGQTLTKQVPVLQ